jgi:hypothetical protein
MVWYRYIGLMPTEVFVEGRTRSYGTVLRSILTSDELTGRMTKAAQG